MSLATYWDNVPYTDIVDDFFATKPKDVDAIANTSAFYYREFLLKKVFAILDWKNIPENWELDYLNTHLFLDGHVIICDTAMGVLPLRSGLTGINVFEEPTKAIIANPVLGNFEKVIGETCALVKLQYNFKGIDTMLRRYSALLAMCDSAIAVNLMNSKVAFVGMASSKKQAESMKLMYDQISCGEPAVFVNENDITQSNFFFNHVKENFVATDIQDLKRSIVAEFLSEIGINNQNIEKKERLISDEVNANNEEISCNVTHWIENIKIGIDQANKLFGLNVEVDIKDFAPEERPQLQEKGSEDNEETD